MLPWLARDLQIGPCAHCAQHKGENADLLHHLPTGHEPLIPLCVCWVYIKRESAQSSFGFIAICL